MPHYMHVFCFAAVNVFGVPIPAGLFIKGNITLFNFLSVTCSAQVATSGVSFGVSLDVNTAAPLSQKISAAFTAVFLAASAEVNKTAAAVK